MLKTTRATIVTLILTTGVESIVSGGALQVRLASSGAVSLMRPARLYDAPVFLIVT